MVQPTNTQVRLLCEWQERLGLSDWRIKLKTEQSRDDMQENDDAGRVTYLENNKVAVIQIVSEAEFPKDAVLEYDFERLLVHELLHLKFSMLDNVQAMQDRLVHQLVDDIARALVCAKRGTLSINIKEES